MVLRINIKKIMAIIVIALAFSDSLKNSLTWLYPLIIMSFFIFFCIIYITKRRVINMNDSRVKNLIFCIKFGMVPYLLILIYSMFIIVSNEKPVHFFMRALGSSFSNIYVVLIVASITYLYKSMSIDIMCNGLILNYLFRVIIGIYQIGINGFITHILDPLNTYENIFESHDIGFALYLFLIYYFFNNFKHNRNKIIVILFLEFLIMKRIAIVGVIIVSVLNFILNIILKKIGNGKYYFCFISLFICSWTYLCFIHNDYFMIIMQEAGIFNRFLFVEALKSYYEFNWTFLGQGYGFVSIVLPSMNIAGETGILALHNNILKDFIELGFFGFFVAYFYFFIYVPIKIFGKLSSKTISIVLSLLTYMFVTLLIDNTFDYIAFMGSLFTIFVILNSNNNSIKGNSI